MRILLLSCSLLPLITWAATITIRCPDKFDSKQVSFSGSPSGWVPYAPSSLEVSTAEIMYGPPSSYTYAVPTIYREGKQTDVATWGMRSAIQDQKWLQCGYGAGKELTLSKQLPQETTECTITKFKDAQGNVQKVIATCSLEGTLPVK